MEYENILKDMDHIIKILSYDSERQENYLISIGIPGAFDEISFEFDSAFEGICSNEKLMKKLTSSQLLMIRAISDAFVRLDKKGVSWNLSITLDPIWKEINQYAQNFLNDSDMND